MEDKKKRAFGLLFITFFMWGSVYVGAKLISGNVPSTLLACLRSCVGACCVLLMARRYKGVVIEKRDMWTLFLIAFLGYYATVNLVQFGIAMTGASIAALINALTPVSVTVFAAVLLKERITVIKFICLILALAGTVVITGGAQSRGEMMGAVAVLISVVTWGLSSVFVRKLTEKYPPVLVTAYGLCISLLFHIPTGIFTCVTQPVELNITGIIVILYLGMAGTGLSQYTWVKSLSILPASTCSLFYPMQAMFSALLGALILHESFTPGFFIGLALICADVALNTFETRRADLNKKTVENQS